MNKNSLIDFIYYYAAVDIILNSVSRMFLLYCTWYFISVRHSGEDLSILLMISWIANPAALLTGNVISRWLGYAKTVKITSIFVALLMITFLFAYNFTDLYHREICFIVFLSFVALTISFSSSILAPLSTPLITIASKDSGSIEKRIKALSNMFIFNLIFGTLLGGIVINIYGGSISIFIDAIISIIGFFAAVMFYENYKKYEILSSIDKRNTLTRLRDGMILVMKTPPELMIAVISMLVNMAIIPAIFLIFPIMILKGGYSIIYVSIAELLVGAGMLVSSSFIMKWIRPVLTPHRIVYSSLIMCVSALLVAALFKSIIAIFFACFLLGIGLSFFNVTTNHKRALSIPDRNLPEMESSLLFLCTLSTPFGFLVARYFIKNINVNGVLVLFVLLVFLAFVVSITSRQLKLMLNDCHVDNIKYYERSYNDIYSG